MLIEVNGKRPQVGKGVYLAPNAMLIGDVIVEDGASIWFGVVLRADQNQIIIGAGSNVQDNSVLHTNELAPTVLEENVTIGHGVAMEACRIGRKAVIGMNSVILELAEIGEGAMVAAGAVVGSGFKCPPAHLAAGVPATVKKPLSGGALEAVEHSAAHYFRLRDEYLGTAREIRDSEQG